MGRDESVLERGQGRRGQGRWNSLGLLLIILSFVLIRMPTVIHAPASQDEEWYGVPGLTVANEGLPRVPYCRAREEGSVFLGAEKILFAQPPLSFYAQAPFFAALPAGYATARLASFTASVLSIFLVHAIAIKLWDDRRIALTAAAFYSFSRLLFFPAMSARPDMLCGTFGLLAIFSMLHWKEKAFVAAVTSGIALGLAALTHPFALVFAIQVGAWTIFRPASWKSRLMSGIVLGLSTAATFSLWLPLILLDTNLFWSQFADNILRPAGPGLLSRFVMPQSAIANQIPQLFERATPIQFLLLALGMVATLVSGIKKHHPSTLLCFLLAISSVYLLIVCVGVHPIQGFWCYPAAFAWLCVAYTVFAACDALPETIPARPLGASLALIVIFAAMIPGSGLRATLTYLTHRGDSDYSSRPFVRRILRDVPDDATITVGREFALDTYGMRRDMILACRHPMYFDSAKWPTDFLILGRRDIEVKMVQGYEAAGHRLDRIETYGNPDDPLCNYAELWKRNK